MKEEENAKKSYLFIQMSFRVVYKWKHEQVINHKAEKCFVRGKGKRREDMWSRGIL